MAADTATGRKQSDEQSNQDTQTEDHQRWEYGPRVVVAVTPTMPIPNEETSPIFAVGSTGFMRQAPQPPAAPPVSLIIQCQRRFAHTQVRLREFQQLRNDLYGDQQFFEQMKAQGTAEEQTDIASYIEAIQRAIGDIQQAA